MAHFASIIPNPVPFTEYNGSVDIPMTSDSSSFKAEGGIVGVSSGPGFGVTIDPAYLRSTVKVSTS